MSTILKALKRLDEERRAEAAPKTLEEQVLGGGSSPHRSPNPNKRIFAAVGVGITLAVGGVYLLATRTPTPEAAITPAPAAAPPARSRDAMAAALAQAEPSALPQSGAPLSGSEFDSSVREQLAARPVRDAQASAESSALPAAGNQPEPNVSGEIPPETRLVEQRARADALRRLAAQRAAETAPAESVTTPPAEPQPQLAAAPESPRSEAIARAEPAPAPSAEPAPAAPSRPTLVVERTQWHPAADKRSALVSSGGDPRELREGDAIEGAVVREIRPSSVLFLFQGDEWKRGVGER